MKSYAVSLLWVLLTALCHGQTPDPDSTTGLASRVFLPSIDMGYQFPTSDLISGSVISKTSIEYRARNNNDFFIRLTYDTYGSRYRLEEFNATTNTIEGTVQFSDVLLGPGYRFGDSTFRLMIAVMGGVKFYEFPTASLDGTTIFVSQEGKSIFTTSVLSVLEVYFDEKSAFTLSLSQNQVWRRVDFWENGIMAFGVSVGFITSLL